MLLGLWPMILSTPLFPAVRRWSQVELYEFKAILFYIEGVRPANATL